MGKETRQERLRGSEEVNSKRKTNFLKEISKKFLFSRLLLNRIKK